MRIIIIAKMTLPIGILSEEKGGQQLVALTALRSSPTTVTLLLTVPKISFCDEVFCDDEHYGISMNVCRFGKGKCPQLWKSTPSSLPRKILRACTKFLVLLVSSRSSCDCLWLAKATWALTGHGLRRQRLGCTYRYHFLRLLSKYPPSALPRGTAYGPSPVYMPLFLLADRLLA